MLARLLGFMLGNRGGLAPKIDSTQVRNACLLLKGPKCCVSRTLEGSPRYRSGSCAICTGPSSLYKAPIKNTLKVGKPTSQKYSCVHMYRISPLKEDNLSKEKWLVHLLRTV